MLRLIILFLLFNSVAQAQGINFIETDLESALNLAKEQGKSLFVDTYTRYCEPCKKMDQEFKDPKLAKYFNDNLINVKVNMMSSSAKAYQDKYQIVFLPTFLFIKPDGNVRLKIDNLTSAHELLHIAQSLYGVDISTMEPAPEQIIAARTSSRPAQSTKINTPKANPPSNNQGYKIPRRVISKTGPSNKPEPKPRANKVEPVVQNKNTEDEGGKILYVMGQEGGDLPPHILKEEAYFRMQLMDGSHHKAASAYLATQEDWSTESNMKFLHDFMHDARSKEFDFLISHQEDFKQLIGEQTLNKTINILVNKELERAFPKPDEQRAELLYSYLGRSNPNDLAREYHLNGLYESNLESDFLSACEAYKNLDSSLDHQLLNRYSSELLKVSTNKKKLKKALKLSEKAITLNNQEVSYHITAAELCMRLGETNQAQKTLELAKTLEPKLAAYQHIQELLAQLNN